MNKKIKLAIVDNETLFRKSIVFLLNNETDFEIVCDYSNGEEFISYLENNEADKHPEIVLLDIRIPVLNGVETFKVIAEKFPGIKVICLSSCDSPHFLELMVQQGISAYLIKNSQPDKVFRTIRGVSRHGIHFEADKINIILNTKRNDRFQKSAIPRLSEREVEILTLICRQLGTKEIAEKLGISERTVEGHRKNMMKKTSTKNIVGLILWGIKNQMVAVE